MPEAWSNVAKTHVYCKQQRVSQVLKFHRQNLYQTECSIDAIILSFNHIKIC